MSFSAYPYERTVDSMQLYKSNVRTSSENRSPYDPPQQPPIETVDTNHGVHPSFWTQAQLWAAYNAGSLPPEYHHLLGQQPNLTPRRMIDGRWFFWRNGEWILDTNQADRVETVTTTTTTADDSIFGFDKSTLLIIGAVAGGLWLLSSMGDEPKRR